MTPFSTALLNHYHRHKRPLPWRVDVSPYRVWLSEMMLQQTTVVTVIPYFHRFLEAFPTLAALAAADEQQVLQLWQGLGYYARARNLHRCAKVLTTEYNGIFPETEAELIKLPGIGPYTAAAIAAMAFNQPTSVLDGNVERVMARLYRVAEPLPGSKETLRRHAEKLICTEDPASYANAIMDLGATICTPKSPKCLICPVATFCASAGTADVENYPKKQPKPKVPHKMGTAYLLTNPKGEIYLQQRPEKGLLANLWEVPSTGWQDRLPAPLIPLIDNGKQTSLGTVKHVFTHFKLTLEVVHVSLEAEGDNWFAPDNLPPLPKLMAKVVAMSQK